MVLIRLKENADPFAFSVYVVRPKRLELPPLRDQILSLARLPIPPRSRLFYFGDPSEIRTPDTLIKSQVLYRLS